MTGERRGAACRCVELAGRLVVLVRVRAMVGVALVLALAGVVVVAGPVAAAEVDAPFDADPLGLIAHRDLSVEMATGTDLWQVWVCDTPGGDLSLDLAGVVALLEQHMVEYFRWMSAGRYELQFAAGGTVQGNYGEDCAGSAGGQAALKALFGGGGGAPAGGLILGVGNSLEGFAGFADGEIVKCDTGGALRWCGGTWPQNQRTVYAGGTSASGELLLSVVAHELGHALNLPHSFGGLITTADGSPWEYDNPTDIMSGSTALVGTIAVNRYANGWLDPEAVAVHDLSSGRWPNTGLGPWAGLVWRCWWCPRASRGCSPCSRDAGVPGTTRACPQAPKAWRPTSSTNPGAATAGRAGALIAGRGPCHRQIGRPLIECPMCTGRATPSTATGGG